MTKQFISQGNFIRLRGSVGRAHVHVGYIFLNSSEDIVVRNPKSKILFFIIIVCYLVCCVWFTIYTYFTLAKVAKAPSCLFMASEARGLHSPSQLWCAISFCLICRSAFWLPLYNLIMVQIVHHSWHLLRVYRVRDSNLSGFRSKSLPIRHLYNQQKYAQWK